MSSEESVANEEYRKMLAELFEQIDDNRELQFYYVFCSEKHKGMQ